jgi:hypothetical protein
MDSPTRSTSGQQKGPLAAAPMFLKNNRRITVLITVICLALLIFCLIERQVRLAIAPQTTLDGLYTGRPAKTHWPADLRSTGTAPSDLRRQRPAIKDSTATTTPDPAAGPPRRRPHQTMMIE